MGLNQDLVVRLSWLHGDKLSHMCQSQQALQGCRLDSPDRARQVGNAISHLSILKSVDSPVPAPRPGHSSRGITNNVGQSSHGIEATCRSDDITQQYDASSQACGCLRDELGLPRCLEMLAKLESEEKKIATLQTTAHRSRQNTYPRLTRPGSTERPRLAVPGHVRVRECPAPLETTRASCTTPTHATIGENTTGSAAILGAASPTHTSRDQRCLNRRHGRRMPSPPISGGWGGARRKPPALTERLAITLPASALVPSIMPTWPSSCLQRPHTVSLRHRDTIKTLPRCQRRATHP